MIRPGKKKNKQIWTALEISLVKDVVSDIPDELKTKIVDKGMLSLLKVDFILAK